MPIHVKEMVPIVLTAALRGRNWSRSVVRFVSAVVQVLKSGYARDGSLMDLMRMLFFIAARFEFWYVVAHFFGRLNGAADAVSRNLLMDLFDAAPNLSRFPLSIPQEMLSLITNQAPDWTSKKWAERFTTLCPTRLPHQQEEHMNPLRDGFSDSARRVTSHLYWYHRTVCICMLHSCFRKKCHL